MLTVRAAHAVQHQVAAVVKLHAHPVPAGLARPQAVGEEFVIHPGRAAHVVRGPADFNATAGFEPGEGNVVRSLARPCRLAANALFAVDDGRFRGAQQQIEGSLLANGPQPLGRQVRGGLQPGNAPVSIPDQPLRRRRARQSGPRPVDPLVPVEPARPDVAHRKVG